MPTKKARALSRTNQRRTIIGEWDWEISAGMQKRWRSIKRRWNSIRVSASAYYNWGWSLKCWGGMVQLLEKDQKAVELDPSSAQAYNNWGWSLGALGRHAEALEKDQAGGTRSELCPGL